MAISAAYAARMARAGWIEGLPGAPGIAMGTGVVVFSSTDLAAVPNRKPEDPRMEEQHLRQAVTRVQEEIRQLSADLDGTLSAADRALFDAYALILDSPEIVEATVARIHQENWAPGALRQTIEGIRGTSTRWKIRTCGNGARTSGGLVIAYSRTCGWVRHHG